MHPVITALIKEGHPLEVICKRADIALRRARSNTMKPAELNRLYAYAEACGISTDDKLRLSLQRHRGRDGGSTAELGTDIAGCLRASAGGGDKPHVLTNRVRRLTPV